MSETITLEGRIQDALDWSWCKLKEFTSARVIETTCWIREFVTVIVNFKREELSWCVDISWEIAPFWNILLVNRSWFLIEEDPFELGGFLFCRYTNDLDTGKQINWIYFPDIPLDIEFPKWYKFCSWTDEEIIVMNENNDKLKYSFDNIRAYAKYIAYKRKLENPDINKSNLTYLEKVIIEAQKVTN